MSRINAHQAGASSCSPELRKAWYTRRCMGSSLSQTIRSFLCGMAAGLATPLVPLPSPPAAASAAASGCAAPCCPLPPAGLNTSFFSRRSM